MSDPGPTTTSQDTQTVLSTLFSVFEAYTVAHRTLSAPYLHPYAPIAPISRKGKSRALALPDRQSQIDALTQIRQSLYDARSVLSAQDSPDRTRLARGLKEVATHQSSLLPMSVLMGLSEDTREILPSPLVRQEPIRLLTSLAERLGIQGYIEESQFGLLKTSLALAGERFVVDVDLETDPSPGDDNADNDDEEELLTAVIEGEKLEGRGRVRLSKLNATYVARGGDTIKSDWIAQVLKERMIRYLDQWNVPAPSILQEGERERKLEELKKGMEEALGELKALDDAEPGNKEGTEGSLEKGHPAMDYFPELEVIAKQVSQWVKGGVVYPPDKGHTLFPTFRLLDDDEPTNPTFRIRPLGRYEPKSPPLLPGETWLKGDWILEFVPSPSAPNPQWPGFVVRRNWLHPTHSEAQEGTNDGVRSTESAQGWTGGVTVEKLLYPLDPSWSFPYSATFSHPNSQPRNLLKEDELDHEMISQTQPGNEIEQHWSLMFPGPEAFLLGRLPIPSLSDLVSLLGLLRRQAVLNQLFCGIFDPRYRRPLSSPLIEEPDGETRMEVESGDRLMEEIDDDDLDELLGPARALPITVRHGQDEITVSFPMPTGTNEDEETTRSMNLTFRPSEDGPYVSTSWDCPRVSQVEEERLRQALTGGCRGMSGVVSHVKLVLQK
ncbi:hypothetical protein M231_00435 [Tremella mesenterica]|uniref:Uncharacterized protein n=1 Tax=Tremella mesenterica TaxID=5217 RepID=A0A4Q1BWB0_TREME|nr:hypothetical protein M231_00435 [Tremella mesenterica]